MSASLRATARWRGRWSGFGTPRALIAAAALAAAAAAACGGGDAPPSPTATVTAPPTARPTAAPTRTAAPAATATSPAPTPPLPPTLGPGPTAPPDAPAVVISRGNTARRSIALTFDAGSGAGFTADILSILRESNVRATFAVTGVWAELNRDLLFSIAADGHPIMNHSYSHPSFTGASTSLPPLTAAERALELSRTEVTVYRYTSRSTMPFFRPPYGDYDDSVLADIAASGYTALVMWTIDTRGWAGASADEIVTRTLDLAEPGAIVVLHVGEQSQDAAALPRIIAGLREAGYAFETIDGIIR